MLAIAMGLRGYLQVAKNLPALFLKDEFIHFDQRQAIAHGREIFKTSKSCHLFGVL